MNETKEKLTPIANNPQNRCFGCGPANAAGLHLEFFLTEDRSVVCLPTVPPAFDSHPGYLHGGIIATLLDEIMAKAVRARGCVSMTRHMEVDYQRPVPSSEPLRMEARVTHSEGRKHWAEAKILNAHGTLLAHGKALFVEISAARMEARAARRPPRPSC